MAKLKLEIKNHVAIITMDEDDNKLNPDMCRSLLDMMDKVERETEALTLVVTSAHDRIWCYGFDIDWVNGRLSEGDTEAVTQFLAIDLELRKCLLSYPLITIAAMRGHVFGGGAVLSLCFDFRFMRLDRGFFCIPTIDRGYPLLPGTTALLLKVMPAYVVEDLVLTGRRITGAECAAQHVVASAHHNDELMDKVMTFAAGLNKGRQIVSEMKQVLNGGILKLMEEDVKYIQGGKLRV
ncbi:MAG: enoyl-CoA hydratase/isomerase family protein [Dehalococcoidia bacterium]|nr:MAG: enoyl-CoA hydratase/isomerase family protein [Dehalococcoidia bacterium]